ncbi:hypothetical protein D6774_02385 [Candidatus Woesearchaeota archaeon]|nr:MAG: hypothetical protein D6774_02385 [Candidatus Woesearchaeota archaeon]
MDIEKLQRVTTLAKEFMHHGMAQSMDDAVTMAEKQIYGTQSVTQIKQGLQSSVVLQEEESSMIVALRKLERVNQTQQRDIASMQQKMNEMIQVINNLESQLNKLKQRPLEQKAQQVIKETVQAQQPQQDQTVAQEEPASQQAEVPRATQGHARSGNFTSNDVSIEKMFYFGVR